MTGAGYAGSWRFWGLTPPGKRINLFVLQNYVRIANLWRIWQSDQ
jgi:hypothetical protein